MMINLFHEYQTLVRSPRLSAEEIERIADIVEIASTNEELLSAIMNLEYLMAQDEGLLELPNIKQYVEQQSQLIEKIESDLTYDSEETSSMLTPRR